MKRFLILLLLAWPTMGWGVSDSCQMQDTTNRPAYAVCDANCISKGSSTCDSANYGGDVGNVGLYVSATSDKTIVRWPGLYRLGIDSGVTAAEVDSGHLMLNCWQHYAGAGDSVIIVKYITENWTEGSGDGAGTCQDAAADSTGSAWYRRLGYVTGGTAWTTAGCGSGSQSSKTDDTTKVTATSAWYTWTISKAACSTWVADSTLNYGMVVQNDADDADAKVFRTDDYAVTPTLRPKFTLYWTDGAPAATPLVIGGSVVIGGNVVIGGK